MTNAKRSVKSIVYATPGGQVAAACESYWRAVDANRLATSAQQYPPHCSLTGFVNIPDDFLEEISELLRDTVALVRRESRPQPLIERHRREDRLGLTLSDTGWIAIAEMFAASCEPLGTEAIRPKQDLHLSLAYGFGFSELDHLELAREAFEGVDLAESTWPSPLGRSASGLSIGAAGSFVGRPSGESCRVDLVRLMMIERASSR